MGGHTGQVDTCLSFGWDRTRWDRYKNEAPSSALVRKVKTGAVGMLAIPLDAAKEHVHEVASLCLSGCF